MRPFAGPQQFEIIDRRAGSLRHAGHGGGLRNPAIVFRQCHNPVGQNATALPAHGEDGNR